MDQMNQMNQKKIMTKIIQIMMKMILTKNMMTMVKTRTKK